MAIHLNLLNNSFLLFWFLFWKKKITEEILGKGEDENHSLDPAPLYQHY